MGVADVEAGDAAAFAGRAGRPGGPARSRRVPAHGRASVPGPRRTPGAAALGSRRPLRVAFLFTIGILTSIYRIDISTADRPDVHGTDRTCWSSPSSDLLKEQPLHGYELKKRAQRDARLPLGRLVRLALSGLRRLERDGPSRWSTPPTLATAPDPGHRLAQRRPPRRRGCADRQAVAAHPQGVRHHPGGRAPASPSCSSTADERRRRPRLRPEARLLPVTSTPTGPPPAPRAAAHQSRRRAHPRPCSRHRHAADRYTRSLVEHRTQSTERDLEWVDSLIAAEHALEAERQTRLTSKPQGAAAS